MAEHGTVAVAAHLGIIDDIILWQDDLHVVASFLDGSAQRGDNIGHAANLCRRKSAWMPACSMACEALHGVQG